MYGKNFGFFLQPKKYFDQIILLKTIDIEAHFWNNFEYCKRSQPFEVAMLFSMSKCNNLTEYIVLSTPTQCATLNENVCIR